MQVFGLVGELGGGLLKVRVMKSGLMSVRGGWLGKLRSRGSG